MAGATNEPAFQLIPDILPPTRSQRRQAQLATRVAELVEGFDRYVDLYDRTYPFTQAKQLVLHRQTIDRRRQLASVTAALEDDGFLRLLYETLRAWGIGVRASVLVPFDDFAAALREHQVQLASLNGDKIEDPSLDAVSTGVALWLIIARWTSSQTRLVSCQAQDPAPSPAGLVPPMDRAWTGQFFEWSQYDLQQKGHSSSSPGRSSWTSPERSGRRASLARTGGQAPRRSSTTRSSATAWQGDSPRLGQSQPCSLLCRL